MNRLLSRILRLRASPRLVAIARIMIGITSMLAALEIWRLLPHFLTPTVIKLPYFAWLPVLPPRGVWAFILLWVLAAVAFVIGWKTRIAGAVLACVIGYNLMLDQQLYSNHLYLLFLIVVLMTITDSGAAISMDARRAERATVSGWPIWLLKIQVSIVYIFSAIAKLTSQYLSGEVLTESLKQYGFFTVPMAWRVPLAMKLLAIVAIGMELFVGLGLWSKRLRPLAVIAGVLFHAFIIAALDSSRLSLSIFALEMFAVYLLFFDEGSGKSLATPTGLRPAGSRGVVL